MPCCLAAIIGLLVPRVLILVLWLFTTWFQGVFSIAILPVLGFIFLPSTLLWYSAVANWYGGHWGGLQIIGLIVAVIIDISPGGKVRARVARRHEVRDVDYE
ncbi:hypothetical protein HQ520_06220 [bacterium]|nr:hypothetical protein [bacterium]